MLVQLALASLCLSTVQAVSTDRAFQSYSTVSVESTFANSLSIDGGNEAAVLADLSSRFGASLAGGPYEVSASLVAVESPHRRAQDSVDRTLTVHYVIQCHADCTAINAQLASIAAPGSPEATAHAEAIISAINTAAAGFGFMGDVVTSSAAEVAATIRAPSIVTINLPDTPGGARDAWIQRLTTTTSTLTWTTVRAYIGQAMYTHLLRLVLPPHRHPLFLAVVPTL